MLRTVFLAAAMVAMPAMAQMTGAAPPAGAAATSDAAGMPAGATTKAADYVKTAGSSDLYEKTSSRLVMADAKDPKVRQFAQMMIDDHAKTTQSVTAAAKQDKLRPAPPALLPPHEKLVSELRAAPRESREQLYVQQQLQAHQQALALHQGFASSGDTPALRQAAAAAVPIVQAHLTQLQGMQTASR